MSGLNPRSGISEESAGRAFQSGRFHDCIAICDRLLAQNPESVLAIQLCGEAHLRAGVSDAAIRVLNRWTEVAPADPRAHLALARAYRSRGDRTGARDAALTAVKLAPGEPVPLHFLGQCQHDLGSFHDAEASFRAALKLDPAVAPIIHGLALAIKAQGRAAEALELLRELVEADPQNIHALTAMRDILIEGADISAATESAEKLVQLQPRSAEALLTLARCLERQGNALEADRNIERAVRIGVDDGKGCALLGRALLARGDSAGAVQQFQRSVELMPRQGAAYLGWISNTKVDPRHLPLIERMQVLASDKTLPPHARDQLYYAIGKAMDDLGEFESAMAAFEGANRLAFLARYGGTEPDQVEYEQVSHHIVDRFSKQFLTQAEDLGQPYEKPIFIVGMIRSGTTLLEQILSCHSQVGAAGELPFWPALLQNFLAAPADALTPQLASQIARDYSAILDRLTPGKTRITDKMPNNFASLGLIHAILPKAPILHLTRHPADIAISIYATPNNARLPWAHSKRAIVNAFRDYQRIMSHWQNCLPPGVIMEVPYRDLVLNQRATVERVLAFCGLPWDEQCMTPELNSRRVDTPSMGQVRRPVYASSLDRWRSYRPWLGALAELTGPKDDSR